MANAHTQSQREFIVRRLAAFEPPRAIVAQFRAIYRDTACDENDVLATDPEKGSIVSPELFALFRAERERVLLDPSSAPFVEQKARLILLSNHVHFHNGNNELATARAVVRQIAEEMGVLGGKSGKASPGGKSEGGEPVVEIVRRVIDPKAPEPEATA